MSGKDFPEPRNPPWKKVTWVEAFWVWVRVAIYSFGGPVGQIAVMHRILVREKRWISENRFLHALNYCMLLPGPEAQQLATYMGWLLQKVPGGLLAGILFVLPGFLSILILSILYAGFREATVVQALFYGLKPAVVAVVVDAVIRIGGYALKNRTMVCLATLAFIAIFFFDVPFPVIVLSAALVGYAGGQIWEDQFLVLRPKEPGSHSHPSLNPLIADDVPVSRPPARRALKVIGICLLLWFGPLFLLRFKEANSIYLREGIFFSKTAVVSFGGAYAALAYIAQEAVNTHGWLQPGEMLDGLGMAETTPGPLIQVVQFVGFMGAYRNPGDLDPMMAGILGSVMTTWVTFVPCFLWIFLGAPYIEYLRGNKSLATALSAITAAVVGVILNLALWFSLHTLFGEVNEIFLHGMHLLLPVTATLDWMALVISIAAFLAMFRFKLGMITTLTASASIGLVYFLLLRG